MSKNSARQTYQAHQEWYNWAKSKYNSLRLKKKNTPVPVWMRDDYEG